MGSDLRSTLKQNPYLAALRGEQRKNRVTIPCDGCGRRIAWWTEDLRFGLGMRDSVYRGWKWQGGDQPLRFRGPVKGPQWTFDSFPDIAPDDPRREYWWVVDAECRSCGWTADIVARQPYIWWLGSPELTRST